jgi:rsbT antagonist protein RsbS
MQIPILKQGEFLFVSIQNSIGDLDLISLENDISEKVGFYRSKGVVIDVTTLDVMDSFSTRMLRNISLTIRLRGAETVIVGIQPEVAFAMIQLGLRFDDVKTALNLEDGVALLNSQFDDLSHGH